MSDESSRSAQSLRNAWAIICVLLILALVGPYGLYLAPKWLAGNLGLGVGLLQSDLEQNAWPIPLVDRAQNNQLTIYIGHAGIAVASVVIITLLAAARALRPGTRTLNQPVTSLKGRSRSRWLVLGVASVLALMSFGYACWLGWSYRTLPLGLHDEYSYLFQAQTFLTVRAAAPLPSHDAAFEQVHIYRGNNVWASRYFPGTGLWIAPFLAAFDLPMLASWVAGAGVALGILLASNFHACTMSNSCDSKRSTSVWLLSQIGLTFMVISMPAWALFANQLLSPMPTMLGMTIGWYAYWQAKEYKSRLWSILCGLAIGFAFLCRPLTAVGLGLPLAIHAITQQLRPSQRALVPFLLLAGSFSLSLLVMGEHNRQTTGSIWLSPYSDYTRRHTPANVYGFNNVERAKLSDSTEIHHAYDRDAKNVTWPYACEMAWKRLCAWLSHSVGVPAFVALGLLALPTCRAWKQEHWLLLAGIAGLHAAYFPYWFTGLFGYSYVVEATPWFVILISLLLRDIQRDYAPWIANWLWTLLLLTAGFQASVVTQGLFARGSELVFPRIEAARVQDLAWQAAQGAPILVLVDTRIESAVHSTLVFNHPLLKGQVLRAWLRETPSGKSPFANLLTGDISLLTEYADRDVYILTYHGFNQPPTWRLFRPKGLPPLKSP